MAPSRRVTIALTMTNFVTVLTGNYTNIYNVENDARQAIVQAYQPEAHAVPSDHAPSPAPRDPQAIPDQPDGADRTTDPEPGQGAEEVEARGQLDALEDWIGSGEAGTSDLTDTIQANIRADREERINAIETRTKIQQTLQDELDAAFAAEAQNTSSVTDASDDAANIGTAVAEAGVASVTHASPEELAIFGELSADERAAELAAMPDGSLRDEYSQMDAWNNHGEATAAAAPSGSDTGAPPSAEIPTFADDTPTFAPEKPAAQSAPSTDPSADTTT